MDIPSTRFAQWYQHCPTYADLAFSGKVPAPDLIYENSLNFVIARYMTLNAKQAVHSRSLLNKLLISVMRGQESTLVSKGLRALDGLLKHISILLKMGRGSNKRIAGFNIPIYYVGNGHPLYLNIDLLLADAPTRLRNNNGKDADRRVVGEKGGIRIIIYHLNPDNEPTRSWILYNPRVMGAVCMASDLKVGYDVAVDIISPHKQMIYRTDLTESYVNECRTQLHHLGRIMSYGILGRLQRKPVTYAYAKKNVNKEESREKLMFERYQRYPSELMDAISRSMINLHNEGVINDTDFLYMYTYLMTDLNFQDLADRYIVGYDTPCPSYSSRQFIHFGLIGKAMKIIIERVQKDYNIKDLLRSADEEQPLEDRSNKISDILKDMSEKEHYVKKKDEHLDKEQ